MVESSNPDPARDELMAAVQGWLKEQNIGTDLTATAPLGMKPSHPTFSLAAKAWLEDNGYEIIELPGNPLIHWKKVDRIPALVDIDKSLPTESCETGYPKSEVAINRLNLFVPGTVGANLSDQERAAFEYSAKLPPSVKLEFGSAAQIVDLVMDDLYKSRIPTIFAEQYGYTGTRTSTQVDRLAHSSVYFDNKGTMRINVKRSIDVNTNPNLGRCALLIPA